MSHNAKAAAAVALLLVAVAGCNAIAAPGKTDGSGATPAPTSTPAASPAATPTPPRALPSPTAIGMNTTDRQLTAGAYRVEDPFRPYTISFPATWTLQTAERVGVALYRTEPESFAPVLVINRVHRVYRDPCHPDPEAPGPATLASAAAIIAELSAMKGFTVGPVTDVTVGGHPAKSFRLSNDITLAEAQQCTGSPLDIGESGLGRITTNQGAVDQIWIVDVNGTAITIDAQWVPGKTPAELIAEVEGVVESIQYER